MKNKYLVRMTIDQVVIFVFMCLFPYYTFGGFSAEECIEEDFHKPYIKVYKKLSGAPEKVMTKPGFLDLYQYKNKIICLNGPMVIYEDAVFSAVDPVNSDTIDDVSNPQVSVVHKRDTNGKPCIPGQDGNPPGFSCESSGSGSGIPIQHSTNGPTTATTTTPSNTLNTELTTTSTTTTPIELVETNTPDPQDPQPITPMEPQGGNTETTEAPCPPAQPMKPKTVDYYTGAKVEVFSHRCLMLNKLPKEEVLRQRQQDNPLTYDRVKQIVPSTKKLGVYMLSNDMSDYSKPSLFQFERPNFEYRPAKLGDTVRPNISHSFALIGDTHEHVFCHTVPGKNGKDTEIQLYMEHIPTKPQICTYPGGSDPTFDTVFRGEDKKSFNWKSCHLENDDRTTPDPNDGREFKQFAFMPPVGSYMRGRARFASPEDSDDDDDELVSNGIGRSGAVARSKSVNRCTHEMENCTQLPVFEECNDQGKTKDDCQFLLSSLGLDDVPDEDNDEVKMLKEVLGLIDSIFGKICRKVPRALSPTISNIFMTYLKDTKLQSRNGTWKFLIGELKTCKTHARSMKFDFDTTMPVKQETETTTMDETTTINGTMDAVTPMTADPTSDPGPIMTETTPTGDTPDEAITPHIEGSTNNEEIKPAESTRRKRSPVTILNYLPRDTATAGIRSLSKVAGELSARKIRGDDMQRNKLANPKSSGNLILENLDDKYTRREVRENNDTPTTLAPAGAPPPPPPPPGTVASPPAGSVDGATTTSPGAPYVPASLPRPIIEVDDFEDNADDSGDAGAIPVNVRVIHERIERRVKREVGSSTRGEVKTPLFYYQEAAELEYMFNSVIDTHWKVFATVAGYCNKFYKARKSETFPRLYNSYFEDLFEPVEGIWKSPADNKALEIVISEFRSELVTRWLDNCMEGSYIVSDSKTYRPPRPLTVKENGEEKTNYFEEIPAEEDFVSENARRALHGGLQHEANAHGKNGLHGGDRVKIPSDPGCHWTCDENGENCHKECGVSDKEAKPKKRTIIHGPNGEKIIVETAISEEVNENEDEAAPSLGRGIIIKNKGRASGSYHKPTQSVKEKLLVAFNPLYNKKKENPRKTKTQVGGRSLSVLNYHQGNPQQKPKHYKKSLGREEILARDHKSQEAIKHQLDEIQALNKHYVRSKERKRERKENKSSMGRRLKHHKGRERSGESRSHFRTRKTTTEKHETEEQQLKFSLARAAATGRLLKMSHKKKHE